MSEDDSQGLLAHIVHFFPIPHLPASPSAKRDGLVSFISLFQQNQCNNVSMQDLMCKKVPRGMGDRMKYLKSAPSKEVPLSCHYLANSRSIQQAKTNLGLFGFTGRSIHKTKPVQHFHNPDARNGECPCIPEQKEKCSYITTHIRRAKPTGDIRAPVPSNQCIAADITTLSSH